MRKVLLVVSSMMVLVTACDSESTSEPASSRSTPSGEISVQVSGEAEETAVYEAAVNAFEDSNDNISVELIKVADGDDHLAKLTTAFAGANPPDVFLINYREYAKFDAGRGDRHRFIGRRSNRFRPVLQASGGCVHVRRRDPMHASEHLLSGCVLQQ
jgi:ABC-type glycerol-3-phosphate transport system substrate-binding protein